MIMHRLASLVAHSLGALVLLAGTADAQLVQGRVRDGLSRLPLDGAVVTLIAESNGTESSVFSDSSATSHTSPPRPPSPPEGPPRGTNFSRRNAVTPLPP
jgi:hypothetical protein